METFTTIEVAAGGIFLLLVSRRVLDLSLSILVSTSSLVVAMIGIVVCGILLVILGLPTAIIGCEILKSYEGGKYVQTGMLYTMCKPKPHTPKIHYSAHVPLLPRPTSAPGRY